MARHVTVTGRTLVHAPPEAVWAVLGDFGSEHRWTRQLVHSARDRDAVEVGTVRRCQLSSPVLGRDRIDEQLVELEPGRQLAYRVIGPVGPFALAQNRWRLEAVPEGTLVTTEATMTPRWGPIGWIMARVARPSMQVLVDEALDEFAHFVEQRSRPVRAEAVVA